MGLLVDGKWQDEWYDTKSTGGKFVRKDSQFRDTISINGKHPPELDRYHLYVSSACPWAHRALIMRSLKGLKSCISVSEVNFLMLTNGWEFSEEFPDHLYTSDFMHQIYTKAEPSYTGRVTVPVLWDKKLNAIVNNESSEILRIFNSEFSEFASSDHDYYPEALKSNIDQINDKIYHGINNGVYKCGFATTQSAYEEALDDLYNNLDWVDSHLEGKEHLVGNTFTEADVRLFTTLIRFDAVYVSHFKCSKKRIQDYANLSKLVAKLYDDERIQSTINMTVIKNHYYMSHTMINPTGVVPVGPDKLF